MPGPERRLQGVGGSDGIAIGPVWLLAEPEHPIAGAGGPAEQARALAALQEVAARLGMASDRLRATGRTDDAEILEASQLMAEDPSLLAEVEALAAHQPAAAALLAATERQAAVLASIPDPYLAARAADVRRLGRQAARQVPLAPRRYGGEPLTPQRLHAEEPDVPLTPRPPLPCAGEGEPVRSLRESVNGADETYLPSPTHGRGVGGEGSPPSVILVAADLGPADLAEIELDGIELAGIALADGSVTSHAAIVARSLGVPLVVGLGAEVLALEHGTTAVVDGTAGLTIAPPSDTTRRDAEAAVERQTRRRALLAESRGRGAVLAGGTPIRLLVNASTAREVLDGLAAGAEGVGLLRTELAFLDAAAWPTPEQHETAVRPLLQHLAGHVATVRTLDFGADKTPPFLHGRPERGIALQLTDDGALAAQFHGLLRAAAGTGLGRGLRIMLPLVEDPGQLVAARTVLAAVHATRDPALPLPALGAMVETRRSVERIEEIAAAADFLSIGTNDLVQDLLGLDRLTPAATVRAAADPRVLRAIQSVAQAAGQRGLSVEVCGEAAGDPRIAILLIGLGVSELSVAPARLDEVRAVVGTVTRPQTEALAVAALAAASSDAVLAHLDTVLADALG